jgi:hypothetical protein
MPASGGATLLLHLALRSDRYSHFHVSITINHEAQGHAIGDRAR